MNKHRRCNDRETGLPFLIVDCPALLSNSFDCLHQCLARAKGRGGEARQFVNLDGVGIKGEKELTDGSRVHRDRRAEARCGVA